MARVRPARGGEGDQTGVDVAVFMLMSVRVFARTAGKKRKEERKKKEEAAHQKARHAFPSPVFFSAQQKRGAGGAQVQSS
jgi:hypothetical protein